MIISGGNIIKYKIHGFIEPGDQEKIIGIANDQLREGEKITKYSYKPRQFISFISKREIDTSQYGALKCRVEVTEADEKSP